MLRYLLALVTLQLPLSGAHADSCIPTTKASVENERFAVEIHLDYSSAINESAPDEPRSVSWSYSLTNKASGKKQTGPITQLAGHSHPQIYISEDGARFAIVERSAETRYDNRVLIFHANGNLVRSLGVNDILNQEELKSVFRSVNHLLWLGVDPDLTSRETPTNELYSKKDNTITLTTKAKRKVVISMATGKILKPSELKPPTP